MEKDKFTATDALALDVEQVEKWARFVVEDSDPKTEFLVSLVVRLRSAADLLADFLFSSSEPVTGEESADAPGGERRAAPRPAQKRNGRDSGGGAKPQPSGSERSVPESGQPSKPSPSPSISLPLGGLHE